ncbi:sensor histidine kinase [Actinospica sp.]|uniref:sensor histidine kinase n=1 Tax=Actinospica sp. TaxID=1872142 RepID=UPI002B67EEFF|nr:sensor histidine kinase [Actinospica sp.]HWG28551.1 sensor histidine kinase [Actinospica sp.]
MASLASGLRGVTSPLTGGLARRPLAVDAVAAISCILVTGPIMMLLAHHSAMTDMRWAGAASSVSCLLLLGARRWPLSTVWATAALCATVMALLPQAPPSAPAVAALFLLAARTNRRTVLRTSAAVGIALTAEAFAVRPGLSTLGANLAVAAWTQLPSALGDAFRSRRELLVSYKERAERAEATSEQEAHRRVAAERLRIARELHDVVAHHLTLVNAQAGVAHHLVRQDAERAYEALGQIRDTSRAALDELRATVGLLRQADDDEPRAPAPGLRDLPALLDSFRHAGLPVDVQRTGPYDAVPPLTDLTAYRVVQEALTNAGKHVGGARAQLTIAVRDNRLEVIVADDGGDGRITRAGTGLGLISLRERVRAADGTLQAGPSPEGGFRVHAVLPLQPRNHALTRSRDHA